MVALGADGLWKLSNGDGMTMHGLWKISETNGIYIKKNNMYYIGSSTYSFIYPKLFTFKIFLYIYLFIFQMATIYPIMVAKVFFLMEL